jgi:hypothetical protein
MILVRKLTLCQYLIFALLLSGPSLCLHRISAVASDAFACLIMQVKTLLV